MASRACALGRTAVVVFLVAFLAAGVWVHSLDGFQITSVIDHGGPSNPLGKTVARVPGAWLDNFHTWPSLWAAPLAAIAGAIGAFVSLRARRHRAAFLASCLVQAGTILTAGFALFPFLLPSSSTPGHSLTVWDASSSQRALLLMLAGVIVFLPVILAYTAWVFRVLKGRITLESPATHGGGY